MKEWVGGEVMKLHVLTLEEGDKRQGREITEVCLKTDFPRSDSGLRHFMSDWFIKKLLNVSLSVKGSKNVRME